MSEFKGTKGEWEYKNIGGRIGFNYPDMDLWFDEGDYNHFGVTKEEAEANAKLISCAPDMLEELQLLLKDHESKNNATKLSMHNQIILEELIKKVTS